MHAGMAVVAAGSVVVLAGCGAGASPPTATATATAGAGASASPTRTPLGIVVIPSAPPSTAPASASSFSPCPAIATGSAPPVSQNGPEGACAAAAVLYPSSGSTCHPPGNGTYASSSSCPLESPLAMRLDSNPTAGSGGGSDPLCRCQNTYTAVTYSVEPSPDPSQPTAHIVRVVLDFGSSRETFDLSVHAVQSGSLVDDIRCAGGGPSTSIMSTPVLPCG